jgi:aryl-alcohol dehydrogenase-like predicted oxidoreductase
MNAMCSRALGCNSLGHIDSTEARRILFTALDRGVTLFDTAASYAHGRSEEELGRWLPPNAPSTIITKFGHPSSASAGLGPASPAHARQTLNGSLRRLRRERIDIWLIHFPDGFTPLPDILGVIDQSMRAGKVGGYGVSNHSASQLRELIATASSMAIARPVLVQAEYSLLNRAVEDELLPLIGQQGIAFAPFFPLAGGLLTGKYSAGRPVAGALRNEAVNRFEERFFTTRNWTQLKRLADLCTNYGVSLHHLALQWLVTRPEVSFPIVGASSAPQVSENCDMMDASLPGRLLALATEMELPAN